MVKKLLLFNDTNHFISNFYMILAIPMQVKLKLETLVEGDPKAPF